MLKTLPILLLCCCLSLSGWALTPVKLALDWYINPDHAAILVAQAKGYFRQQGLLVQLLTPVEGDEPAQLLAANQVTLAVDYEPEVLTQITHGMPLVVIANLINRPLTCVAVLANGPVHSLSQLTNKSIGSTSSGSNLAVIGAMLAHNDVALSQVNLIDIKMNLIQALLSHRVDAVSGMMRNVEPVQMRLMGYQTRLFYPEDNGVPSYNELVIVANAKDANPFVITHFRIALQEAVNDLLVHPMADWRLVSNAFHTQLAPTPQIAKTNKAIWMATLPYIERRPAAFNKMQYQAFERFMRAHHQLSQAVPADVYFWHSGS